MATTKAPQPYHEERPWGEFIEFTRNTPSTVKIITVKPGEALSLQHHANRDEFWSVISGDGSATIGDTTLPLNPGDSHFVRRGTPHRLSGGNTLLTILEISLGDFDENDIVRLEDRYGRAGSAS
jgi:mannose-6-phosphate isomerase-like protein (cupin superfamily)